MKTAGVLPADPEHGGRRKKYKQGPVLTTLCELEAEIERGNWVFWRHKPLHPGWLSNMTLRTLSGAIKAKILFKAEMEPQ